MTKLEVLAPSTWTWKSGQHVADRFPSLSLLHNHPFTISPIDHDDPMADKSFGKQNVLTFLIRSHTGFMRKILSHVQANTDVSTRVFPRWSPTAVCQES